jgi:hypothetical protein
MNACRFNDSCDRRNRCPKVHATVCTVKEPGKSSSGRPCGFAFAANQLYVSHYEVKQQYFLLCVRRNKPYRELMFMPAVNNNAGQLHSNNQLSESHTVWSRILDSVIPDLRRDAKMADAKMTPVETISINFGIWESGVSLDDDALSLNRSVLHSCNTNQRDILDDKFIHE